MPNPLAPPTEVSAVAGLRRAADRFERAAGEVARAGPVASNAAVMQISPEARAAAQRKIGGGTEESLVDQRVAKHAYQANLKTLQAADEMTEDLLDVLA